jgi:hypothetical protein
MRLAFLRPGTFRRYGTFAWKRSPAAGEITKITKFLLVVFVIFVAFVIRLALGGLDGTSILRL